MFVGLLASFWEFPATDIEAPVEYNVRVQKINTYLKFVLGNSVTPSLKSLDTSKKKKNKTSNSERKFVATTDHVFSHIKQKLHVERIIISDETFWKEFVEDGKEKKKGKE